MMNDIRKYLIARTPHQKRALIEEVKEMPADLAPPIAPAADSRSRPRHLLGL
jgi:hypothetical protein